MANDVWYDYFLKTLISRYPKKGQLAQELMNLLCLEREAVYRRLRKDVMFGAHEVAKIASVWNIPLDEIVNISTGKITFQMQPVDYVDPSDQEERFLKEIVQGILRTGKLSDTEYMLVCNKVPRPLFASYSYLYQFYLFRWIYQYGNKANAVPLSQITIPEKEYRLATDYSKAVKQVSNTNFIFDYKLFENLVRDVQYFHSIRLIADEEKELIKNDLCDLLNYLSEVASKGYYPETRNKVNLYVSQLSVDTNYSYYYTGESNVCLVQAFDKYGIYTFNSEMVNHFIAWMKLKKRTSVQISEVDEKSRIDFFERQQQIVDSL